MFCFVHLLIISRSMLICLQEYSFHCHANFLVAASHIPENPIIMVAITNQILASYVGGTIATKFLTMGSVSKVVVFDARTATPGSLSNKLS